MILSNILLALVLCTLCTGDGLECFEINMFAGDDRTNEFVIFNDPTNRQFRVDWITFGRRSPVRNTHVLHGNKLTRIYNDFVTNKTNCVNSVFTGKPYEYKLGPAFPTPITIDTNWYIAYLNTTFVLFETELNWVGTLYVDAWTRKPFQFIMNKDHVNPEPWDTICYVTILNENDGCDLLAFQISPIFGCT